MITAVFDLPNLQAYERWNNERVDNLLVRNIDMKGKRVINAGKSQGDFDYITKAELTQALQELSPTMQTTTPITGLLNAAQVVRYGAFSTRGSATAHISELFIATDLDYICWLSIGSGWIYQFGTRKIAQSAISTFTANLGTNDAGCQIKVTDYMHTLEWSGSALSWAAGDDMSGHYRLCETAPDPITGWQICDGSTVNRLNKDGTVTSVTVKNVTTARYLKGGLSAAAVAGYSGNTPTGTNSAPTFTGNSSGSTDVQSGSGASVAPVFTPSGSVSAPTFTGNAMNSLELPNLQGILYYRQ